MTKIERGGNTIVLEHYPVAKLPADLQKEIGDADEVKLTIETPVPHRPRRALKESSRALTRCGRTARSSQSRPRRQWRGFERCVMSGIHDCDAMPIYLARVDISAVTIEPPSD